MSLLYSCLLDFASRGVSPNSPYTLFEERVGGVWKRFMKGLAAMWWLIVLIQAGTLGIHLKSHRADKWLELTIDQAIAIVITSTIAVGISVRATRGGLFPTSE